MKLRDSGSLASGIHGVPHSDSLSQACARLKQCPISCTAVQKRIRRANASGAGSFGGSSEMNESEKIAQPCRWAVPMSSNMMPPSLRPRS